MIVTHNFVNTKLLGFKPFSYRIHALYVIP